MRNPDVKSVSCEISKDMWKRLRIIAIKKDISLSQYLREMIEKNISVKRNENEEGNV